MSKTKTKVPEVIKWIPKQVNVKDVKPTPNNFKIKSDLGKERLGKSLELFGLAGTVVCNTDLTLIDGNSRLTDAKEKGEKKIWVSLPSRKLTPKEFQEMSAMYDYAQAGEVDIERIKGELGKTADFFNKWGMAVPKTVLDKLGSKKGAESSYVESNSKKGKEEKTVKVKEPEMQVTLFFSPKEEAEFRKMEERLSKKFKSIGTTQTVLKVFRAAK